MNNLKEFLESIPEIATSDLKAQDKGSSGIAPRIYFWANKSSLRKDSDRGRLYGNWQRQITAPCMFNARLYVKISDIVRQEELDDTCDDGDVIIELLSKGPAYLD